MDKLGYFHYLPNPDLYTQTAPSIKIAATKHAEKITKSLSECFFGSFLSFFLMSDLAATFWAIKPIEPWPSLPWAEGSFGFFTGIGCTTSTLTGRSLGWAGDWAWPLFGCIPLTCF